MRANVDLTIRSDLMTSANDLPRVSLAVRMSQVRTIDEDNVGILPIASPGTTVREEMPSYEDPYAKTGGPPKEPESPRSARSRTTRKARRKIATKSLASPRKLASPKSRR